MANKAKKKRNKKYQGADASAKQPTVTKVTAVNRNRLSQWWFERKKVAKPVLIGALVVAVIIWLIFELVRIAQ